MTSSLPICSTAAATTAIATVFGHDLGRWSPATVHRPSRSRREMKRSTRRIGTSLGKMRNTLWPITINAPSRTSRRETQRSRAVSARSSAYADAACRIYVEGSAFPVNLTAACRSWTDDRFASVNARRLHRPGAVETFRRVSDDTERVDCRSRASANSKNKPPLSHQHRSS